MRAISLLGLLAVGAAQADSLYSPGSNFAGLWSDHRAARVGDVLHIVITETAQANQTVTNNVSNATETQMGPGLGSLSFIPLLGYQGDSQTQSRGNATRSESFVARVAVTVTGLSPTGNLLVEGCRQVGVNKDLQVIKLTGEVRPDDVTEDNTVPSYKVANAGISYTGSEPLKPGKKVGIITRVLHWLF